MDWRAEVEAARQMVAIHETLRMPGAAHPHRVIVEMGDAIEAATRERDEARAEVERLRASETERRELMPAVLDAVRKVAREEEREACAAVADEYAVDARAIAARCDGRFPATAESARIRAEAAEILAAAIRARGEGGAR